ncbi:MAG: UDP-N-acetylmuramate dehydrogenase [Proteobacteria bacterium]|nr:UDP-N-acetylmuramate dehydrogenase [Desulfobacula sp.]MBU4133133.1 UDP-N-acetylmuramate dehydrogenase [Pseudomonadota bacterium]
MTADKNHSRLKENFKLLSQEPLRRYTSFRVGGPADLLGLPKDRQSLVDLLLAAKKENIPVSIIGGGTNILVSDKGIRGLVIVLSEFKSLPCRVEAPQNTQKDTKTIIADAGERLSTVCNFAMDQGLSGLEFAAGIPGTLGGAIMMNAGTATWNISQAVASVETIDTKTLLYQTLEKKDLAFSYRKLCLEDNILLGAHFTLTTADPKLIRKRFDQQMKNKKATQPVSLASAGCFFKNPPNNLPAGKLIEDAGLKGKKINGAMVSELHANFIINTGNARCADILALKRLIQKTVFEKFQIQLETEVKVTGE